MLHNLEIFTEHKKSLKISTQDGSDFKINKDKKINLQMKQFFLYLESCYYNKETHFDL